MQRDEGLFPQKGVPLEEHGSGNDYWDDWKKSDKADGEEDEAMSLGIQVKTQPKRKSSKTAAAANLSTVLAGKWQNV